MNEAIQCLWIGSQLSKLEILSLRSYLRHGHQVHLYCYGPIAGVPSGIELRDGNEILSEQKIFSYQKGFGKGSYSAFSNQFRYALLYKKGGWYSDLDVVCLRPFDFSEPYIFAEQVGKWSQRINGHVIKVPAHCEIIKYCLDRSLSVDQDTLTWGKIGPKLLTRAVRKFRLTSYAKDCTVFSPIRSKEVWRFFQPYELPPTGFAVHLFQEMWRSGDWDRNGSFAPDSLFETLKRQYLNEEG